MLIYLPAAMSVFSLYFVYRRNETDMKSIMSSKINTIQSMLQDGVRQASSYQELARNPDVMAFVESVELKKIQGGGKA